MSSFRPHAAGSASGTAVIQTVGGWLRFSAPERVITARQVADVLPALREVEGAVARGRYAAGFLAYEAAPAFDDALVVHDPGPLPLLWFGLYRAPEMLAALTPAGDPFTLAGWAPAIDEAQYRAAFARIKDYIAAGDTYQVNYTLRLRSAFAGDPWSLFTTLARAQRGHCAAYLDLGDHVLCSASPELFFRLDGDTLTCRPMKGTAPRGRTTAEDDARARWLAASEKNRAENVMIVDMIRNDLSRVARTGSVQVRRLFEVERYETVLQMTSTVTAETDAPMPEILRALFPCASITGAPKVRTMQIIRELEPAPRGVYTGGIGWWGPDRRAQFNVAIRTVAVDRAAGQAEYGVGGGIVWDSVDHDEYAECLLKARVLAAGRPAFDLLETLLWIPGRGYFLRDRHLRRLADSARYFGILLDLARAEARLAEAAAGLAPRRHRMRLLVAEDGEVRVEAFPLERSVPRRPWTIAAASAPVDVDDRFLYHKTTHRAVYDAARASCPGCDEVILWNARGEVTEGTITNLVACFGAELLTPPIACGLLPGTYRAHLLDRGCMREEVITLDRLRTADAVYLVNSVRGWIPTRWA